MNNKETFFFNTNLGIEDSNQSSPGTLTGYAMKFNVLSHDRGGYRDVFRPGVFGETFTEFGEGFDVKAYLDHDEQHYLGRTSNGTLRLAVDDTGLRFSLDLPDTQLGRDTAALVKRKDLSAMSFGYVPDEFRWDDVGRGPIREHLKGTLVETSIVYQPAFPFTEVELSSMGDVPADVAASLEEWKRERAGTPLRNRARRILRLEELKTRA